MLKNAIESRIIIVIHVTDCKGLDTMMEKVCFASGRSRCLDYGRFSSRWFNSI